MKYRNKTAWVILFLISAIVLNAQTTFKSIHVEKAIIKGYYELSSDGLCYIRKGHTISIKGKTYPFYMRIEDNSTIRKWTNPFDTLEYRKFINMDLLWMHKEVFIKEIFIYLILNMDMIVLLYIPQVRFTILRIVAVN